MNKLNVWASLIDSYIFYINGAPFMDLETLLKRINRVQEPPTPALLKGSAFHNVVQAKTVTAVPLAEVKGRVCYEVDGFTFPCDIVDNFREFVKGSLYEVGIEKSLKISGVNVTLYGYIDALRGPKVYEIKTTGRYTWPKYANSYQWRVYKWASGLEEVTYLITDFKDQYLEVYTQSNQVIENDLKRTLSGLIAFIKKYQNYITNEKLFKQVPTTLTRSNIGQVW